MDSNDKEVKYFSFKEISPFNTDILPASITVSGIHRAVLEDDLMSVKRLVEAGESVNTKEEHSGFTSLHLAVIRNSLEILDYLLSRDDIEVDARCSTGDTPLKTASGLGAYESVKKLIDAGAHVNLPDDKDVSPLHVSVQYPNICHLLIQNGADIDAVDSCGLTPLHYAVKVESLEAIYMLLYYNADANAPDEDNYTPFMFAIRYRKTEAQCALMEYVDDFNAATYHPWHLFSNTIMGLALGYESPFVKEMIERGADVNYGDDIAMRKDDCAFMQCLYFIRDETIFKTVWDHLSCYQIRAPINMLKLFDIKDRTYLVNVLQIIIESDNLEVAVDSFTRIDYLFGAFFNCFVASNLEVEQLVVLTYRLLEYGYCPTIADFHVIFSKFGPCELTRLLLYMNIDYRDIWEPETKTYLCPMFELDFNARFLAARLDSGECQLTNEEVVSFLQHFHDGRLVNALRLKFSDDKCVSEILDGLPKVPSLVELARNQARKHICERFRVSNISQFYTIVDHLNIPSVYKNILTYRRKIYMIKQ